MAAQSSSVLRRALLYVPASSPRMLTKSLGLTSDNITYDLEDSVTPSAKPEARAQLRAHLLASPTRPPTVSELAIRVNPVSSPYIDADLTSLAPLPNIDAVVVPKVNSASDLQYISQALSHHARSPQREPPKIIALIESARAVMDLRSICAAAPGALSGLIFAAEDFALDLSITRTPDLKEFLYARSAIVTAARAAGLPSVIDLVCTSYKGEAGLARLEEECRGGKAMGFNGKQCIHPSQVETVQRLFAPSEKEVEWAVRITIADEKAAAAGKGAWTLDGAMIDAPVAGKAKSIVDKAQRCGIDVKSLQEKWKDQEPE
ncbi:beta subunit of citrate lyase [Annulohypoxylon truncatum]|uniref:beta subunit of citrate lyase n=1 Tax=Annulohypoxylon truncatum TaxID=327061 RepID=UPI002007B147|nr:beta subunit of citrate lyase [Annulohypoxylon truncatum]KAI1209108.1 beta subunit of citrate lyase [Annulohypoxylon truncatum]